jgi:NADH oxidoreductase Hcr
VIFAEEWRDYPVTLVAEHNATHGFVPGRLSRELLQSVPDIANRTVMTCGPAPYMDIVEKEVKALGVTRFFKEQFFTPVAEAATSGIKFTKLQPAQTFFGRVGTTLLEALESNKVPVVAVLPGVLRLYVKRKYCQSTMTRRRGNCRRQRMLRRASRWLHPT